MRSNMPPVKQGDRMEVEIVNQGRKENNMVAKYNGYVIFVQDYAGQIGEKVEVEITAALPKYGFAKIVENTEDFGEE